MKHSVLYFFVSIAGSTDGVDKTKKQRLDGNIPPTIRFVKIVTERENKKDFFLAVEANNIMQNQQGFESVCWAFCVYPPPPTSQLM